MRIYSNIQLSLLGVMIRHPTPPMQLFVYSFTMLLSNDLLTIISEFKNRSMLPFACLTPVLSATDLPRFLGCFIKPIRPPYFLTISEVLSVEPSSTTMISSLSLDNPAPIGGRENWQTGGRLCYNMARLLKQMAALPFPWIRYNYGLQPY